VRELIEPSSGVMVMGSRNTVAVVGEYGVVAVQPGSETMLQVLQCWITNDDTAAQQIFPIRVFTRAQLAALGTLQGDRFGLTQVSATEIGKQTSSFTKSWNNPTTAGTATVHARVNAGETMMWHPPRPGILLFGNDPGGVPGFGITSLAGVACRGSFCCVEWRLRRVG
jgi:hypothetical protein